MNIPALQATLRQFAADRDWQPFHTPKNLAMALMGEAAELAEIFQWLTPEQSARAHQDAALRPRIADELADVLLYLLQLADHTACDLDRAVADKLVKNARKHPPLPARALRQATAAPATASAAARTPAASGATSSAITPTTPASPSLHVLLDFENVQPDEAALRALVPGLTHLWLFHGPHQKGMAQRFAGFGADLSLVPISQSGKNALDFHLSFYAGYIVSRYPQAAIVVVANDKGYAPMLKHADALGFDVRQVGHARVAAAKRAPAVPRKAAAPQPKPTPKPTPKAKAEPKPRPQPVPAAAAVAAPLAAPPVAARKAARKTAAKPAIKPTKQPTRQAVAPETPAPRNAPPALKMVQILARRAAAGPATATAAAAAATPAPAPTAVVAPRKLLASLRRMGDSLPTKQGRLLSTLKSLLGPDAAAADALAALARLVSTGQVVVTPGGVVSYRL